MSTCSNPILGWLRSIILLSSLLKWWSIFLSCRWGGVHFLRQHILRQSRPQREINQLFMISVSRGWGYDLLHNSREKRACLKGISLLTLLLGGSRQWTARVLDRRIHFWHGRGDNIVVGHVWGNLLFLFVYTHTCPLTHIGKSFWCLCTSTFLRLCWERCSTGFWRSSNRQYE